MVLRYISDRPLATDGPFAGAGGEVPERAESESVEVRPLLATGG